MDERHQRGPHLQPHSMRGVRDTRMSKRGGELTEKEKLNGTRDVKVVRNSLM